MHKLTDSEIDEIERGLSRELPALYHKLLVELGCGSIGAIEIYHPLQVRELYEPFFDDPGQLFNPYFPFGCHNT